MRLAALAPRVSALLGGLEGEAPKQPIAKPGFRVVDAVAVGLERMWVDA